MPPASAKWEHVNTREEFTAEAAKLGYSLVGTDWKHESGAKVYDGALCEILEAFGPSAYAETLARMEEQLRPRRR